MNRKEGPEPWSLSERELDSFPSGMEPNQVPLLPEPRGGHEYYLSYRVPVGHEEITWSPRLLSSLGCS